MVETIIQLEMVRRERHPSGQLSGGITTPTSDTSRTLSPTASVHRLSGQQYTLNYCIPGGLSVYYYHIHFLQVYG